MKSATQLVQSCPRRTARERTLAGRFWIALHGSVLQCWEILRKTRASITKERLHEDEIGDHCSERISGQPENCLLGLMAEDEWLAWAHCYSFDQHLNAARSEGLPDEIFVTRRYATDGDEHITTIQEGVNSLRKLFVIVARILHGDLVKSHRLESASETGADRVEALKRVAHGFSGNDFGASDEYAYTWVAKYFDPVIATTCKMSLNRRCDDRAPHDYVRAFVTLFSLMTDIPAECNGLAERYALP